jgi:hypothetical protein
LLCIALPRFALLCICFASLCRFRDPIVSSIGDMVLVQGSDRIKHRRHGTGSEI